MTNKPSYEGKVLVVVPENVMNLYKTVLDKEGLLAGSMILSSEVTLGNRPVTGLRRAVAEHQPVSVVITEVRNRRDIQALKTSGLHTKIGVIPEGLPGKDDLKLVLRMGDRIEAVLPNDLISSVETAVRKAVTRVEYDERMKRLLADQ